MSTYEVLPLIATQERAEIVSEVVRKLASVESAFNDFQRGCEEGCWDKEAGEMCEKCFGRMQYVSKELLKPDACVWEVWKVDEETELAGVIRLSGILPGRDAVAHYVFFDRSLTDKVGVMKEMIEWAFEDHPESDWQALRRVTVEIPQHAYILARHAHKKLGFGGPYYYKLKDSMPVFDPGLPEAKKGSIRVEGVKRGVIPWRGKWEDLLIMGLENEKLTPQDSNL